MQNTRLRVKYDADILRSAMRKIEKVAFEFHGNALAVEFQDIIGTKITPFEFKVFLEKTFALKLSIPEVGSFFSFRVVITSLSLSLS
jgi:hypothetical protein